MNHMLKALQENMKRENIQYYVVPTGDPHGSETPAPYYGERRRLTGFTGSAGTALVHEESGYCWVDGRYYIQGERQLKGSGFQLMKDGLPETPSIAEFLDQRVQPGDAVGFNGKTMSPAFLQKLKDALKDKDVKWVDQDLLSPLWEDRPEMPNSDIIILEDEYASGSMEEKLERIRDELYAKSRDFVVLGALDDIAYLTGLRGDDIPYTPVFYGFMVVTKRDATLYLPKNRVTREIGDHLRKGNIAIREYEKMYEDAESSRGATVTVDPGTINVTLYEALKKGNRVIEETSPVAKMKGKKNREELDHLMDAYLADGVALSRFFQQVEKRDDLTEGEAQRILREYRKEHPLFLGESFHPISAFGPNGAMMHYGVEDHEGDLIGKDSFYLIDSGGQYFTGTTDITRTLGCGELTDEMKEDYTLVLQGHIALLSTVFLQGTTGHALDAIARRPLWMKKKDYKSGTGHGVGYLLAVHEGPHNISPKAVNVPLEPGMVVTVEPGIYREGEYGIRLENVAVVEEEGKSPDGTFFRFRLLSYIPFDRKSIVKEMLSETERQWIDDYHRETYQRLKDHLGKEESEWLKEATKPL